MRTTTGCLIAYLCLLCLGAARLGDALATESQGPEAVAPPAVALSPKDALDQDHVCTRCHDENETKPILAIYQTRHGVRSDPGAPTCQSCHGASEKHLHGDAGSKGRPPPDVVFISGAYHASDDRTRASACLACHKGTNRSRWMGGAHQASGMACNDCHTVHIAHDPVLSKLTQQEVCFTCHKEQRADTLKVSTHPLEAGKMACTDCHNPHGAAGPKLLKTNSVNETCWQCHADKRGPFLWEHQRAVEDCTNCHNPHGSNISPLLKSRPPFLCQECHDGPHNSKSPVGPNAAGFQGGLAAMNAANSGLIFPSTQAAARGCMNCHAMVHGSNDPAGEFLHR